VESGVIILIGATTENPSFEVIPPLLSRCRVYVLEPLTAEDLGKILDHALASDPFLKKRTVTVGEQERILLMRLSGGDARSMLTGLDTAIRLVEPSPDGSVTVTPESVEQAFQRKHNRYDSDGEEHYNIISAFIKSMRGCDPDAAIYWMARMLDGGEDPKFIARRMLILASEDIGNADPSALPLATSCFTAVDYVGMPEARIILAQTAAYLASAPKSNAAVSAIDDALHDVRALPADPVPLHLRNAPTKLMKDLEYGKDYLYGHGFETNFVPQQYLPEALRNKLYYRPTENGEETNIKRRLNQWWKEKPR
jgi:putative ATPase